MKNKQHTVSEIQKAVYYALKKQMPIRPTPELVGGVHLHQCASCHSYVQRNTLYCSHCGQALDWRDTNA